MKRVITPLLPLLLAGCVDLGQVGMHPTMQQGYFNASVERTYRCLETSALEQQLFIEEDEPFSNGDKRYNLTRGGEVVGWMDISLFNKAQSMVNVYYNPKDKALEQNIEEMMRTCKQSEL